MREINIEFQEQYKKLDAICKDVFACNEGVSSYISEMENKSVQFDRYYSNWEVICKRLKHMRWVRNKLAHEVGSFDSDLCTENDLEWLANFYNAILNRTDILARLRQLERESLAQRQRVSQSKNIVSAHSNPQNRAVEKKSLWRKIKDKFKQWFS